MAVLSKKLYIKNSAGTQQTANLYSTTSESGSPYMNATVDGTAAYAPLVSTSDARATSGRVLTSGGTTYAIGNASVPAYAYKTFTTAGSGTFTVPSGVTKLRVTCVGGGAGGASGFIMPSSGSAAAGSCSAPVGTVTTYTGGSATTFGSVSAAGGTNVQVKYYYVQSTCQSCSGGRDPVCTSYTCYPAQAWSIPSYGYHNGARSSTTDGLSGGAAVPLVAYNGTTIISAGAGGYADSGNTSCPRSCGGGSSNDVISGASGYRTVSTITVTPGQVLSYTVGRGGNWYRKGSNAYYDYEWGSGGHHGSPGLTGAILVEYGKGIE